MITTGLLNKQDRYLIQQISECAHPKTMLSTRFVKFLENITKSNKVCVRYLAKLVKDDRRTLVGKTLSKLALELNCERSAVNASLVKRLDYHPISEQEKWRVPLIMELIDTRNRKLLIPGFSFDEIEDLLSEVATS